MPNRGNYKLHHKKKGHEIKCCMPRVTLPAELPPQVWWKMYVVICGWHPHIGWAAHIPTLNTLMGSKVLLEAKTGSNAVNFLCLHIYCCTIYTWGLPMRNMKDKMKPEGCRVPNNMILHLARIWSRLQLIAARVVRHEKQFPTPPPYPASTAIVSYRGIQEAYSNSSMTQTID